MVLEPEPQTIFVETKAKKGVRDDIDATVTHTYA